MFTKEVDLTNRVKMIKFLMSHFRYYTMNSWNQSTSYANNIKLYNLDIPQELQAKAYDFIAAKCEEYSSALDDKFHEFLEDTGYALGINGRSGGYIVMYDTERQNDDTLAVMPGRGIDMYEDFGDWETSDIVERVKLVQTFDKLCDDVRDLFLHYVEHCEIKDTEVIHKETVRVAELTDFFNA